MSTEQSALAAAGFELPPDPLAYDKRREALSFAVKAAESQGALSAADIVAQAEAFHSFLTGKPAQPKE